MVKKSILIPLMAIAVSFFAIADGDPEAGKKLSQYSAGCHGESGIADNPTNPNLAGQNAKYLIYALQSYRDGTRKGGLAVVMRSNAIRLSDQNIEDLAAYFSSQPGKSAH